MKLKIGKRFHSIKFRLMLLITLMLLIVVGFPVSFFVYQLDKNYNEFSINMIETASQVVYQFIYDGMMKNDSTIIQKNLEILSMDPSIQLVRLYRPTGRILFSSERTEIHQDIKDLSEETAFFRGDSGEVESFVHKDNIYSHHHPVYIQKECSPCHQNVGKLIAILDVHAGFTSSAQLYSTSKNLAIFGGAIIIVILWILLNLLYQSQVESRLKTIIAGFENISMGDFKFKINMPGRHELAILAEKFNQMVDNLQKAREQEEQFLQEKLERADRLVTLGEVAAEIAHEVNNPAGIILTRAEFLKEEMKEQDPDSACVNDLDIIIQQTDKIADTTRSILHYSKKLPQSFSETDLNKLIKHAIKILGPRINKCSVNIELKLMRESSTIWGNYNQLEQVFCNLINNSLDFVKPGEGLIKIQAHKITTDKKSTKYQIIYHDNGPGIPDEYRDKIFSPFFTTKDADKGTGLGLFIVKNIISHHKGTISLENHKYKGARFIIELEAYEAQS